MSFKLETTCKGCCFATFSEKSQTGCKLGRLEKYLELGTKHQVVQDDGGQETYRLEGRICVAKRSEEWAKAQGGEGAVAAVLAEIQQPIDVIIPAMGEATLKEIEVTVNSLVLTPHPKRFGSINVLVSSKMRGPAIEWVRNRFFGTTQVWWVTMVQEEFRDNFYKVADIGFSKTKSPFYLAIAAGLKAPKSLADWLNNQVNVDLRQLLLAHPSDVDWYVASARIHKFFEGSCTDEVEYETEGGDSVRVTLPSLPAKVQYFADSTGNQELIQQVEF